jgi:DNA replication protein DnaC
LNEVDMLDDFARASLLVIDEIGVGFGSEAEQVQLFDIIDARYKHRRPTILLSNLPAKDLKTALGERAYDRLREGSQILVCQWGSYRGNGSSRAPLEAVK